jgi:type VI protein secretion system component Hcp
MGLYLKLDGVKGDATLGTGSLPEQQAPKNAEEAAKNAKEYEHWLEQAGTQNYQDWMNINSMAWSITNKITTRSGTDADVKASKTPTVNEITITKDFDTASANLVRTICKENTPRTCCIRFVKTDFIGQHYLEFILQQVLLTSWSMSTDKEGTPNEVFVLNFTSFKMSYYPTDAKNVTNMKLPPQRAAYDLIKKA